jgi:hypothetical protein
MFVATCLLLPQAITGPAHSLAATAAEPTAASAAKPPVPKPAAAPTKPKPTPSTVPAVAEAPAVAAPVPAKSALPARPAQHAQRGGGVRRGGWRGGAARPAALAGSKRRKQVGSTVQFVTGSRWRLAVLIMVSGGELHGGL